MHIYGFHLGTSNFALSFKFNYIYIGAVYQLLFYLYVSETTYIIFTNHHQNGSQK